MIFILFKKIIEYCDIADILLDEYERDYQLFQSSKSFQLSTSMCIIQIGEYVSRLSDKFKEQHNHIPWKNFYVFHYFCEYFCIMGCSLMDKIITGVNDSFFSIIVTL